MDQWFYWTMFAVFVLGIVGAIFEHRSKAKKALQLTRAKHDAAEFDRVMNFGRSDTYSAPDSPSSPRGTIVSIVDKNAVASMFDLDQILSVDIETETTSTTKTRLGSMVTRAAVGGALVGPIGALAGAATANKTTASLVTSIKVRVVTSSNVRRLVFYLGEAKPASALTAEFDEAHRAVARLTSR